MMEKAKTLILALLVAGSLLQSYYLAFSGPKFDMIDMTSYVPSELKGTQAKLEDLVNPSQLVLHFGNKKHTVIPQPQNTQFYQMIYNDFLKTRQFQTFHRTSLFLDTMDWQDIANNNPGIEIRFDTGIPVSVLKDVLQIRDEAGFDTETITKIWIYLTEKDEVKAYFFSDTNMAVYEALKTDLDPGKVKTNIALGQYMPSYHMWAGDYYLPDEPITINQYTMTYNQFSPDLLRRSLFADPSLARILQDRNGSQMYTDSKRGLEIRADKRWFIYTDPLSPPADARKDARDNLLSAVQFVNQHGGWNGTYMLTDLAPKQATGAQTFIFRQYVDNIPIVSTKDDLYGFIKVVAQKGFISNYQRSMLNLESKDAKKAEASLPGGKALDDMLRGYSKSSQVVNVFPAYSELLSDKAVQLIPRWAVELRDGTYEFL